MDDPRLEQGARSDALRRRKVWTHRVFSQQYYANDTRHCSDACRLRVFSYKRRQCGIRDAFERQISHTPAAKADSTKFADIAPKTQVTRIKRLVFKAFPLTVVIDRIRRLRGKSRMNKFAVLNQGLATASKKGRCVAKRSIAEAVRHTKRRRVD